MTRVYSDARAAALYDVLNPSGRYAFETRSPAARAWEGWAATILDTVDPSGSPVRISYDVESVVDDVVTVTEATSDPDGTPPRVDRASLRILGVEELDRFLSDAGFLVETRYGGRHGEPFEAGSPEIVTVARRVGR